MDEKLEREVKTFPAFDKRDPNPSKDYGIHGMNLCFYLKGKKGAVQFVIYTNWQLPHVQKEMIANCKGSKTEYAECHFCRMEPMAADIGYHSPTPIYEGQEPMSDTCHLLGGKCYYDGSSLNAERYYEIMVTKGSDALWEAMEEYYNSVFNSQVRR